MSEICYALRPRDSEDCRFIRLVTEVRVGGKQSQNSFTRVFGFC